MHVQVVDQQSQHPRWGLVRIAQRCTGRHDWRRSAFGLPVVKAERGSVVVGVQSGAYVADDVVREVAGLVPGDLGALAWLGVDGLARPVGCCEEHSDAGEAVGVCVVGKVGEGKVCWVDYDADFFECFACCGCGEGLAVFEGAAGDGPGAVGEAGVRTAQEEHFLSVGEDEVDADVRAVAGGLRGHDHDLRVGERGSWGCHATAPVHAGAVACQDPLPVCRDHREHCRDQVR